MIALEVEEPDSENSPPLSLSLPAPVVEEALSAEATFAAPPDKGAEVISALMFKVSPVVMPEM